MGMRATLIKRGMLDIAGILVTCAALGLAFYFLGRWIVDTQTMPHTGETLADILEAFELAFLVNAAMALAAVLLWQGILWVHSVTRPDDAGARALWAVVGAVLVVASVIAAYALFDAPASGAGWAYLGLVVPVAFLYYFPTALFTPAAFKYSPPLANRLRPRRW